MYIYIHNNQYIYRYVYVYIYVHILCISDIPRYFQPRPEADVSCAGLTAAVGGGLPRGCWTSSNLGDSENQKDFKRTSRSPDISQLSRCVSATGRATEMRRVLEEAGFHPSSQIVVEKVLDFLRVNTSVYIV
jgi:hypothetical protein